VLQEVLVVELHMTVHILKPGHLAKPYALVVDEAILDLCCMPQSSHLFLVHCPRERTVSQEQCSTVSEFNIRTVCMFITTVPITKLFAWGGGGDKGGHVLRETTSRGLCGPSLPITH
jgi:hypothetical protein